MVRCIECGREMEEPASLLCEECGGDPKEEQPEEETEDGTDSEG